jgi:hypothetical protein
MCHDSPSERDVLGAGLIEPSSGQEVLMTIWVNAQLLQSDALLLRMQGVIDNYNMS